MQFLSLLLLLVPPQEPDSTHMDPESMARQAGTEHRLGDLSRDANHWRAAEAGYREIIHQWSDTSYAESAREGLGDVLLALNRPQEARDEFLRLTVNDARPLLVKIGKCYEVEGAWERALEKYREGARRGPNDFGGCGTCMDQKALSSKTRIARCLDKLRRNEEAMKICREVLLESDGGTGGRSTELAIIAVDIALRTGRIRDFERELWAAPGVHAQTALDYLDLLRRRRDGDVEGLFFRSLQGEKHKTSLINHRWRWKDMCPGSSLIVEAAECLAELGEPAFSWLQYQVREGGDTNAMWAVIVMAHFRDSRARDVARDPPWKPLNPDDAMEFSRMLEGIASETPRRRPYPPSEKESSSTGVVPWVIVGSAAGALLVAGAIHFRRRKTAPG